MPEEEEGGGITAKRTSEHDEADDPAALKSKVEALVNAVRFGVQSQVIDILTENKDICNHTGKELSLHRCCHIHSNPMESNRNPLSLCTPNLRLHDLYYRHARPRMCTLGCEERRR